MVGKEPASLLKLPGISTRSHLGGGRGVGQKSLPFAVETAPQFNKIPAGLGGVSQGILSPAGAVGVRIVSVETAP